MARRPCRTSISKSLVMLLHSPRQRLNRPQHENPCLDRTQAARPPVGASCRAFDFRLKTVPFSPACDDWRQPCRRLRDGGAYRRCRSYERLIGYGTPNLRHFQVQFAWTRAWRTCLQKNHPAAPLLISRGLRRSSASVVQFDRGARLTQTGSVVSLRGPFAALHEPPPREIILPASDAQ